MGIGTPMREFRTLPILTPASDPVRKNIISSMCHHDGIWIGGQCYWYEGQLFLSSYTPFIMMANAIKADLSPPEESVKHPDVDVLSIPDTDPYKEGCACVHLGPVVCSCHLRGLEPELSNQFIFDGF